MLTLLGLQTPLLEYNSLDKICLRVYFIIFVFIRIIRNAVRSGKSDSTVSICWYFVYKLLHFVNSCLSNELGKLFLDAVGPCITMSSIL